MAGKERRRKSNQQIRSLIYFALWLLVIAIFIILAETVHSFSPHVRQIADAKQAVSFLHRAV